MVEFDVGKKGLVSHLKRVISHMNGWRVKSCDPITSLITLVNIMI